MWKYILLAMCLCWSARAQRPGTQKANFKLPLPITVNGQVLKTSAVISDNWRWIHNNGGYENCFANDAWVTKYCPDPIQCVKNCELEGVTEEEYKSTYGVTVDGRGAVTLRYKTVSPITGGTNWGSRLHLLDVSGKKYFGFNLLNSEFRFTVDVSRLPCGTNGALYFVDLPLDGGLNDLNTAGAPYGTGYGDAQGPRDIRFINGWANTNKTGIFSPEMDIWEANSMATQMTPHVCRFMSAGTRPCGNDADCGQNGLCDKAGADYAPYRLGLRDFYGPGKTIDTAKPITVLTEFWTDTNTSAGTLIAIKRKYIQNGVTYEGGSITDAEAAARHEAFNEVDRFTSMGGLAQMGRSLTQATLILSQWDDWTARMGWLDGKAYPPNTTGPGVPRGPCPWEQGDPEYVRSKFPDSQVTFSDIQLKPLNHNDSGGGTTPAPSATPAPTSPVPVTPAPSGGGGGVCAPQWGQCGGIGWNGPTCCLAGWTCVVQTPYYSQCLATSGPTPAPTTAKPTPAPSTPAPSATPAPTSPVTPKPSPAPSTPAPSAPSGGGGDLCASNRYYCSACTCISA